MMENERRYCGNIEGNIDERESVDGDLRQDIQNLLPIKRIGSNMYSKSAEHIRQCLTHYFMNEGALPYQWNK